VAERHGALVQCRLEEPHDDPGGSRLSQGALRRGVCTPGVAHHVAPAASSPPAPGAAFAARAGAALGPARGLLSPYGRRRAGHRLDPAGRPTTPCVHRCDGNPSHRQRLLKRYNGERPALVRQAKLGAACRMQVPAEDGLTNHSSRGLPLWRRCNPNEPGEAYTGHHGDCRRDRTLPRWRQPRDRGSCRRRWSERSSSLYRGSVVVSVPRVGRGPPRAW
jgi:hypothetical protein